MEQHIGNTGNGAGIESDMASGKILVVGATGNLGQKIITHLGALKATVIALVRANSDPSRIALLRQQGVTVSAVDFDNPVQLAKAVAGVDCIVSAVNGLEDVILDLQTKLLDAAVQARVPRFIPSDYSIDYTGLPDGTNRNLDLRRSFSERINKASISPTTIFCGMFTDLLTGQAPVVLFGIHRVIYWGNADQLLDFTTVENTAAYTARAALDPSTPRYLRIAGDVLSAKGLKLAASQAVKKDFKLLRAGSLGRLQLIINITRKLFPQKNVVFPPWQGMQYMHNMYSGKARLTNLDNDRYPGMKWTTVREVLASRIK